MKRLRRLVLDTVADLRGHDIPLAAAGLTFYAAVALVPLLLVALWLSSLVLGGDHVRTFGARLAHTIGPYHHLNDAVWQLTQAGSRAQLPALITAALISTLYGEGITRAFRRLGWPGRGGAAADDGAVTHVLWGRLTAPLLVAVTGVLVGIGLMLVAWLSGAIGSGFWPTVLGVYLAFLSCWAGATACIALSYRVFGPSRLRFGPLMWGAASAGSWIAGSALGFLLVLRMPIGLGKAFAGSDAVGAAALLAFWSYFSHVAVLLGYAGALRMSAGPREQQRTVDLTGTDQPHPADRAAEPAPAEQQPAAPGPVTVAEDDQARLALRG